MRYKLNKDGWTGGMNNFQYDHQVIFKQHPDSKLLHGACIKYECQAY